jgi:exodeoxyribonuclease VII small subunit
MKHVADKQQESSTQESFEQALAALEQIVRDLEDGRLGLAESLARYEQGIKLLKNCYAQLEQAERRIELLTGIDAAGNAVVAPFDGTATLVGDHKESPPRSRRSSSATNSQSECVSQAQSPRPAMDEPGSLF